MCESNFFEEFLVEENFTSVDDDLLSSSQRPSSQTDNSIQIQKFHLIRYLEHKIFDASITDYIPRLLSNAFKSHISVYTVNGDELKELASFMYEVDKSPRINLLFMHRQRHYMALTNKDIDDRNSTIFKKLNSQSENSSLMKQMKKNNFYGDVARLFEASILVFFVIFNLKKKSRIYRFFKKTLQF